MAIAVPPSQHTPLPWQGEISPHCHPGAHPCLQPGKGLCLFWGESNQVTCKTLIMTFIFYLGKLCPLLHPIVLLLIFPSSADNSSQSAWKHCTAPATLCRGSRQHNSTRNKSLFWLCLGQWVSWCSGNTLVVTIMTTNVSMDKSGWAASLWSFCYNPPE